MASLVAPSQPIAELSPEHLEQFIIAGIHQDRSPGRVLVILHPLKTYKLPDGLFEGLEDSGFQVTIQHTAADELESVCGIRDALLVAAAEPEPLDVIVIGGDGTIDHHFLLGAAAAFYPELVTLRPGTLAVEGLAEADLAELPGDWVSKLRLLEPIEAQEPSQEEVREIWVLRMRIEDAIRKRWSVRKLLSKLDRAADDPVLRVAVLATAAPERVTLHAPGFDLAGLAGATQEQTFRGLYPWVRSVTAYPAGTAADNAVFSGIPGLLLGLSSRTLRRFMVLAPLHRWLSRRTLDDFLDVFCRDSTIVPTRISLISLDGRWQRIGSHATGGPGSGRLFAGDLVSKPAGVTGYVMRLLPALLKEAVFGTTQLSIEAYSAHGELKSSMSGGIAEGLYTNRTFLAAMGSVPTTAPTSFAGESSLVMLPAILSRRPGGPREVSLLGLMAITEAAFKGITSRLMHFVGLDPGRFAGEGDLISLPPSYQVSLKEGAEVRIRYSDASGFPRAVPIQISGDAYQASRMQMRVFWGPLPMLAANGSLLHASARRTLRHLRLQTSYNLKATSIGGVHYFWYGAGAMARHEIEAQTGVAAPRLHLHRDLRTAAEQICARWQALDTGAFVDTSGPGLSLGRNEVRMHNNDQSAHVLLLRNSWRRLLVRQVRRTADDAVVEARSHYRRSFGAWVIMDSQILRWESDQTARILYEEHFFRDAQNFQGAAPSFFPLLSQPGRPILPTQWREDD
ncbi:MAG: hypothetical protein ACI8S6_000706 [Myxococcota bacterium]|jgi:hypothetical protein